VTRCVEFYDYWDEHPDFCGKSPATVSYINSYAKVLNELKEHGVEKSFTIVNFPEGNARPIFPLKDPIRTQVLKNVASWLLTNRKPSLADVKAWTSLYNGKRPECKEPEPCSLNRPEYPIVNRCAKFNKETRGCGRPLELICPLSDHQRKSEGCHLEGMQPPNGGRQEPAHGILAICKTRNKGEPCEHFTKRTMNNNRECSLTGYLPGNMTQCPLDAKEGTVIPITEEKRMEIAAKVAHVPVEQLRPSDKTGPFTPASEIPKGLVDLNTPDTRTDLKTFTPVHPITRTDPLDKANGVVKMQKATDYETLAKEGDMYPLSKLKARVMNQMVEYGLAADNLDANILYDKEGPHIWLGKIDGIIDQEDAS